MLSEFGRKMFYNTLQNIKFNYLIVYKEIDN